ncbi:DNA-3-methyladenine glycosylase I [Alloscardovia criceti]|uniref:DNA-3-methyladenine glycosylase I n=1 Tax=Alloscardovia criceti TaxID=356828 RepID=UPI0003694418|nr:DNA-3-methyladenine glycosylase I [Alloscardovia criceti]
MAQCAWADSGNALMRTYHDTEWGTPCHDSRKLFELLSLEIMQAGLSWQTVLNKRAAMREAFADFDVHRVAQLDTQFEDLMANAGIIRNRRKINAIIHNATVVEDLENAGQSLDAYIWRFVDNTPIVHHIHDAEDLPNTIDIAKKASTRMKADGFRFAGPVVVYSFFQAAGLANDHEVNCWRYEELVK